MATGSIQRLSEAQIAHYHNLKRIIKRNRDEALEWLQAVYEVRTTCMWMHDCATWDEFCLKYLGLTARQIRDKMGNVTTDKGESPPKLPPPAESDHLQITGHAELMAKRFFGFVKTYVKLTEAWPGLDQQQRATFDARLSEFAGDFELFLADHGAISEGHRRLQPRIKKAQGRGRR